jgi:uncharacterized protein (DUF2336 family)
MLHTSIVTELESTIAHLSQERRVQILGQITDLFVDGSSRFSDREIELFDVVIMRLATQIELSARELLASRFAPLTRAPLNITRLLANDDEITVAGPILRQSERVDDCTLVAAARAKGQAHLLAISQRRSLSEAVTDILVSRGSPEVALRTAENPGAKFSKAGFSILVDRSKGDDRLAISVSNRSDLPQHLLRKLLLTASQLVRAKLVMENPQLKPEIDQAVNVASEKIRADTETEWKDYADARSYVRSLNKSGQLTEAIIRNFAETGKIKETMIAISQVCDVPLDLVEEAFNQEQTETILIFAKAARLTWPTAKALLSVRSEQPAQASALSSFDRLSAATACKILEFYKSRHASILSPKEPTKN